MQYRRPPRRPHLASRTCAPWLVAVLTLVGTLALPPRASALDFGGVGLGTQLLVVDGEEGAAAGLGLNVRTRFLWVLGLEMTLANVQSSEAVWGATPYRAALLVHAVQHPAFHLYLSPGLAGERFGDAFNPVGDTTWYRVGGGLEFRLVEGLRLGAELHWTIPSQTVLERYVDENQDRLLADYLESYGASARPPRSIADVSTSQLLDVLPLDRFEFAVNLRYYF
jgi:hypothetical protein